MAIKSLRKRATKKPPKIHIKLDGGYSCNTDSEIGDNQCADARNVWYDGKRITSRPGLQQVFATSVGTGQINGFMDYHKPDGTVVTLVHWGTGLYTQSGSNDPVLIYSGLANARSVAFVADVNFFLLDGTNFVYYDGTTVKNVTDNAYVPTITQQRAPNGSKSTPKETLNLISNSFIDSFTSDGTAVYQMSITGLTSIDEVKIAGNLQNSSTYTVDLPNGKVTFNTGPVAAAGIVTDNVTIKGTKNSLKDFNQIRKCRFATIYNDRVWLTGNPDHPATVYRTGIVVSDTTRNPFYYPDNYPHTIEPANDPNGPMVPHNSSLIVFKAHSTHRADPSSNTNFEFDWNVVNYTVGCDMPYSVQLVNNDVIFAATYKGVCLLRSVILGKGDERSIDTISVNINGSAKAGLLDEQTTDLQAATSADDGRRYWLCVGSKAWVWDYILTPYKNDPWALAWWPMTNINANCWLLRGTDLYFGDRDKGILVKFVTGLYSDLGQAIDKRLKTKKFDFGYPEWEKDIPYLWLVQESGQNSRTTVNYYADDGETTDNSEWIQTYGFDFDSIDFDNLQLDAETNNTTIPLAPDIRGTVQFQAEFSNNIVGQNLSIISLSAQIELNKEVS